MRVNLAYGESHLTVDMPDGRTTVIEPSHTAGLKDEKAAIFQALDSPIAAKPLRDTGIGSRTGLSVVALRQGDVLNGTLTSETVLPADAELLLLGSQGQRETFESLYGATARRP